MEPRLEPRKMRILQAITDDYIRTADPVGSRTIARKYELGVSPATIRNEMADLEELGYLEQPHTSAGRVPSDKGYRLYVDQLMSPEIIAPEERDRLIEEVISLQRAMEHMIHRATRLLSLLTRYTAVVLAPRVSETTIRHIQLTLLDAFNILVVVVTEPGFVRNYIVESDRPLDAQAIDSLNRELNEVFVNRSQKDVTRTVLSEIRESMGESSFAEETLAGVMNGLSSDDDSRVHLDGTLYLFEQPEFRDVERAKALLGFLERDETLSDLLADAAGQGGTQVTIGHEHSHSEMYECSMVTATYSVGNTAVGTVGIIGPTRLDYAKVVSVVGVMADSLSEVLARLSHRS